MSLATSLLFFLAPTSTPLFFLALTSTPQPLPILVAQVLAPISSHTCSIAFHAVNRVLVFILSFSLSTCRHLTHYEPTSKYSFFSMVVFLPAVSLAYYRSKRIMLIIYVDQEPLKIRIPYANMQAYIAAALQREAQDILSSSGDGMADSLEQLPGSSKDVHDDFGVFPVHPTTPPLKELTSIPRPPKSGKAAKDKHRRQYKRHLFYEDLLVHPRHSLNQKHPVPEGLAVSYDAASLPTSTGCWVGKQQAGGKEELTLEELHQKDYNVFQWGGRYGSDIFLGYAFIHIVFL